MADFKRTIVVCSLLFFTACASHKAPAPPIVAVSPTLPVIAGPQEGFLLAMDAYKVNDMATAILIGQQVVDQYPNNPWQKRSLFLTGRALIALDRTAEAESVLLRVTAEYPELADYALFFLGVFAVAWALRARLRAHKLFLLAASYAFYAHWDWRFLPLLVAVFFGRAFCGGVCALGAIQELVN